MLERVQFVTASSPRDLSDSENLPYCWVESFSARGRVKRFSNDNNPHYIPLLNIIKKNKKKTNSIFPFIVSHSSLQTISLYDQLTTLENVCTSTRSQLPLHTLLFEYPRKFRRSERQIFARSHVIRKNFLHNFVPRLTPRQEEKQRERERRIAQEETRHQDSLHGGLASWYPPPFISIDTSNTGRRDFIPPRRLTRERRSHFISLVGWHGYINL